MIAKVAIIAPGAMGSAVGRRLSAHGVRVLTSLTGRSIATVRRAEMTGMINVDDDAIAQADVILSILPPNEAFALAERFAGPLSRASHKAIFADCNAINVETVHRIDAVITPSLRRWRNHRSATRAQRQPHLLFFWASRPGPGRAL